MGLRDFPLEEDGFRTIGPSHETLLLFFRRSGRCLRKEAG